MAEETLRLKQWSIGETVTGVKLNKQLSEQLQKLFSRNIVHHRRSNILGTESVLASGANTFCPMDTPIKWVHTMNADGVLRLEIDISFEITRRTGANTFATGRIDVKVDDDWFVSSRTSTALSDGLFIHSVNVRSRNYTFHGEWMIPDIAAGLHKFEIFQSVDDNTFGTTINQIGITVEQYGKSIADQTIYGEPL